jgi:AcrR family transcriptional regulator
MRADARRNRERVLAAAEEVFGERGEAASTEEVARRAGVGIGTVFRHFPTKEELYEAIVVRRLTRLADSAPTDTTDPRAAFEEFFASVIEEAAAKKAFAERMAVLSLDVKSKASAVGERVKDQLRELFERAQRAGTIRADVEFAEVMVLLAGASLAAERTESPALRRKARTILLDGLRT